jgi:hypothetical protein
MPDQPIDGKESRSRYRSRKQQEIAKRRAEVSERYIKGWSYDAIAKDLGSNTSTVGEDVQAMLAHYGHTAGIHISAHIASEFAKINRLEAEAWEDYESSNKPQRTAAARKVVSPLTDEDGKPVLGDDGKPITVESSVSSASEYHPTHRDMRCHARICWCIEKRMKLFNLVKATQKQEDEKKGKASSWVEMRAMEIAEREANMINVTPAKDEKAPTTRQPQLPNRALP